MGKFDELTKRYVERSPNIPIDAFLRLSELRGWYRDLIEALKTDESVSDARRKDLGKFFREQLTAVEKDSQWGEKLLDRVKKQTFPNL